MDKLAIQASPPLAGDVIISGAKNAALPILMAGVLAETDFVVSNVPNLRDVSTSCKLLRCLGADVDELGEVRSVFRPRTLMSFVLLTTSLRPCVPRF